ncbi:MAG: hypothetical protein Q9160_003734 [Pyrenula sp. 1 TL-2023]
MSHLPAPLLQAHLTHTTTQLIQRFETILFQALPSTSQQTPSHTQTSISSSLIATETDALISSAEELTSLTRVLKRIWLAGGLDVLEKPRQQEGKGEEDEDVKNKEHEENVDWETLGRQKLHEVLKSWKGRMEDSLNFSANQGDDTGGAEDEEGEENGKVRIKQEKGEGDAGHEKESSVESSRTVGRGEANGDRDKDGDGDEVDVKMEEVS